MNLAQLKKLFSYLIKNNIKFKILYSDDIDYENISISWKYPPYYPRHYIVSSIVKEINEFIERKKDYFIKLVFESIDNNENSVVLNLPWKLISVSKIV